MNGLETEAGVWQRLKRWRLVFKRARFHLHSPDPHYQEKVALINSALQEARDCPENVRLLFGDEVGVYRQPLLSSAWQKRGREAMKATLSHRSNTRWRMVGCLDACTGQVVWRGASKVGVKALCGWLEQIRTFYGEKMRLVLAWDNWPVHRHEKVLAAAQTQQIELLFLPTYAPWTNPVEKLWRKLKQEIIYLHRHAEEWDMLKQRIGEFLNQWEAPSPELLTYVGLGDKTN